jgi:hypothetical protein
MDGGDAQRCDQIRARRVVKAITKVRQSIAEAEVGSD